MTQQTKWLWRTTEQTETIMNPLSARSIDSALMILKNRTLLMTTRNNTFAVVKPPFATFSSVKHVSPSLHFLCEISIPLLNLDIPIINSLF